MDPTRLSRWNQAKDRSGILRLSEPRLRNALPSRAALGTDRHCHDGTRFPWDRPRDRLPRSTREITNATAGLQVGTGTAAGGAGDRGLQRPGLSRRPRDRRRLLLRMLAIS